MDNINSQKYKVIAVTLYSNQTNININLSNKYLYLIVFRSIYYWSWRGKSNCWKFMKNHLLLKFLYAIKIFNNDTVYGCNSIGW
jgi:hypothetical protein